MKSRKLLFLLIIAVVVALYFIFDLGRYFSLDVLKEQQAAIAAWREANPWLAPAYFFVLYVAVTALSLPGAALMTLAGGAIFGLWWGTLIVSFASSIGATLAFLVARFFLRDWVTARFGKRLEAIDAGIRREGAFYLFTLRLVPVFPFFLINLLSGLTAMKTRSFYWVSQLGMLAGTVVYVNAGTQLAKIDSLSGIVSPGLLISFALLGIFPLMAKKIVEIVHKNKVFAPWTKPRRFDRNLVVIGGGSAGLVTAYIAAAVKAKVTLIEKHQMGGDCLNTGCVPSKALIRSAKFLSHVGRARELGCRSASADFSFAEVMERVQRVVQTVAPHDSVERYTGLGVEVIEGTAKLVTPWEVEVTRNSGASERLTTRGVVIAAGARPFVPPIPGIEEVGYLTSDTVWDLRELPQRLVVLGGGPIGAELTQTFARLGAKVVQVEMAPRIMIREDPEVSAMVTQRFRAEGIDVLVNHKAKQFLVEDGEKILIAEHEGRDVRIPFDAVLVAVGRIANLQGYGLEEIGIPATRTVETNEYLQTNYPNIYAAGDVTGPYQFTHTAAHQAWYAAVNALFDPFKKFKADYSVIPWATFVEPEVARVGLNEQEAREKNIPYEVSRYDID
ncbi:MAG: FAD-dependent oxidoreductase, partial [Rhodocyclaceae bacterium]|nr:FAD-dependent oxidoreductase [Rhodocyclaceae bacterium]